RRLHPHAQRALVVPGGAWADPPTAETLLDAMALGRIDYYVPAPAASPDEVFHQAISSFLLEWATERRIVPHTVHIVGEEWSGRAYELKEVFERCAVPHAICLADEQASVFGASFVFMHRATALARTVDGLDLSLSDGRRIGAAAVILATGASYRRLGVPSLEALNGAGVFYGGPASEGHALIGKDVYVVGGGNSAGQAALYLARYVRRVTLLVRAQSLDAGMSHYLVPEIE